MASTCWVGPTVGPNPRRNGLYLLGGPHSRYQPPEKWPLPAGWAPRSVPTPGEMASTCWVGPTVGPNPRRNGLYLLGGPHSRSQPPEKLPLPTGWAPQSVPTPGEMASTCWVGPTVGPNPRRNGLYLLGGPHSRSRRYGEVILLGCIATEAPSNP
jgi:hypothetical protein